MLATNIKTKVLVIRSLRKFQETLVFQVGLKKFIRNNISIRKSIKIRKGTKIRKNIKMRKVHNFLKFRLWMLERLEKIKVNGYF